MIRLLFLFLLFGACGASAQTKYSIVYGFGEASNGQFPHESFLAIDDSVAFSTTIKIRHQKSSLQSPLGSKFRSHNCYVNLAKKLKLTQSQPYNGPRYLVKDTLEKIDWLAVEGEQNILGYSCKKAIVKKNNQTYVAWYTTELPVPFGPQGYGGLPGLILEFTHETTQATERAISIENGAPVIVEPKGKEITAEEFHKILSELRR